MKEILEEIFHITVTWKSLKGILEVIFSNCGVTWKSIKEILEITFYTFNCNLEEFERNSGNPILDF